MGRVGTETVRFKLPLMTNEFIRRKPSEGLEALGKVVGHQEDGQVLTQLLMGSVIITINGRFLEGAVHALDLAICPRVIRFRQAMVNTPFGTDTVKQQGKGIAVSGPVGELNAVVSQNGVNFVGNGGHKATKKGNCNWSGCAFM